MSQGFMNIASRDLYRRSVLLLIALLGAWGCASPDPQGPVVPPPPTGGGSCGDGPVVFRPLDGGLAPVGTDSTLDLATWNLEFFPLRLPGDYDCPHPVSTTRIEQTADLINLLDLDVIAVEEVSDPDGFDQLIALCPKYSGYVSPERRGCNYQRPAFIYKTSEVTVRSTKLLFSQSEYVFPRSPLQADLTITTAKGSYALNLIVVHLKASGDQESQDRRRAASAQLKAYLDQQAIDNPTANYMIAGDWNDIINEPAAASSFPAFLDDSQDYEFLSAVLAGKSEFASHSFSGGSLIDHLLVNSAACPDFEGSRVTTLRLDLLLPSYGNISDHRPVMVQAPVFR